MSDGGDFPLRGTTRSLPPPAERAGGPASTLPPSEGDEFLFHLYRGSELLREDRTAEARDDLERALALRPRDVEGQSLLGVTYFRLGHYPRAIEIYEELVRARPAEVAPRVDLALCYLKTGQHALARLLLEDTVERHPDHQRAWGYLGLAYQRLGERQRAMVALERAGHHQLAARLRAEDEAAISASGRPPAEQFQVEELSRAAFQAAVSLPPPPMILPERPTKVPPPADRTPGGGPGAAGEGAARVALGPPGEIRAEAGGPVRVHALSGFRARASGISLVLSAADPPAGAAPALRSSLLGGDDSATRLVDLDGPARLLLEPRAGAAVEVYTPGDEPLTLRMDRVLGWEASLRAEPGRAAGGGPLAQTVALVRFTGEGRVVAERSGPLRAVELPPGATVAVAAARLHGWRGRVTLLAPGAAEAGTAELLRLSGGGVLLLEGAVPEQDAPSGRFAV